MSDEELGRQAIDHPIDQQRGTGAQTGYVFRDAFRLLSILTMGSVPLDHADPQSEFDHRFIGEKRAMAIDFLVRYPDYLAHDLLDLYEVDQNVETLNAVERIFADAEPDVRLVKMIRWSRGAFQNIETALAVLHCRELIKPMQRGLSSGGFQFEYLVGQKARDFLASAIEEQPSLRWYERQVALALRVAGTRSGTKLKDSQHEHDEYHSTPYGSVIPSIKEKVLKRLDEIKARGR
jgi:hypothetical protein